MTNRDQCVKRTDTTLTVCCSNNPATLNSCSTFHKKPPSPLKACRLNVQYHMTALVLRAEESFIRYLIALKKCVLPSEIPSTQRAEEEEDSEVWHGRTHHLLLDLHHLVSPSLHFTGQIGGGRG